MSFTIECREGNSYSVAEAGDPVGDFGWRINALCWDELLGCIARICLTESVPRGPVAFDWVRERAVLWTWTVTQVEPTGFYTIEDGTGRFIEQLSFDEMLGFVARYIIEGKETFHGFLTYEQWLGRFPYSIERKIAGLLPVYLSFERQSP